MIEKLSRVDFDKVYSLMERSFPSDEYRSYDEQKALLDNPLYQIYVIRENEVVKAFSAVWDLEEFSFIEHLAVHPACRNGGLGAQILNELVKLLGKTVCLEVEPPETEMAVRRIGFYQRNNFFVNHYPYMQPSISKGKNPIPLLIMTWGSPVNEETFQRIKSLLYTKVYKCV